MSKGIKAFISYSHFDEHFLERFVTHLAMLQRDRLINEWFDQKIMPGGGIDAEVSAHLEECELFIPLVSPDFLNSDYCYERELSSALERHEKAELRVVPIIVQPCDWQSSPLGRLKALPKDGKPVSDWTNRNTAWLDVVQQLRRLAEEFEAPKPIQTAAKPEKRAATSRYRIKQDYDEVDKMEFREKAFAIIRDYFKEASAEIAGVDGIKSKFAIMSDDAFTCTVVNRGRDRAVAHITVHTKTSRMSIGDLSYAFSERAEPGTANGWMRIESDDYELYLNLQAMMSGTDKDEKLSPRQAAERLWEDFLKQADITYG